MISWRPQTPAQAILWELWRTGRGDLLIRSLTALSFCLLIYAIGRFAELGPESWVISGMLILILTISASAAHSWMSRLTVSDTGFNLQWQLLHPIGTVSLVGLTLAYTLLTSFFSFAAPALLFRWLTGINVPLLGPLAIIGCLVVCLFASTWAPRSMLARFVALTLVILVTSTIAILASRRVDEPVLMYIGRPETFYFGWSFYLALGAIASIAFALTCIAVKRQRCGDSLLGELWSKRVASDAGKQAQVLASAGRSLKQGFKGPVSAQLWYEYQNFGKRVLVLSCLLPMAVGCLIVVALILGYDPSGADRVWMIVLIIAPIVYQVVGIDGALGLRSFRGSLRMSTFDATRPLSSVQLIEIKLLMIAVSSILGWLILAACAGAYAMFLGDSQIWLENGRRVIQALCEAPVFSGTLLALSLALTLTSSSALLLAVWLWLPRYPWLSNAFTLVATLHVCLFVWDSTHQFPLLPLWKAYGYFLPVCGFATAAWIIWRAYSRGICRTRLFALGCLLSVVSLVCGIMAIQRFELIGSNLAKPQITLVLVAMLLTPVASIAAAPLAFDLHRHQ